MKNRLTILLACLLLVMLAPVMSAPVVAAEPSYTDWIVTGDEVKEDETITLYRKVLVKSGGSLTLRNVTLTLDNPIMEEYGIIAEPGSSLAIYSSTLGRPTHLEGGFSIQVENASFVMKDSVLEGASHWCPPEFKDWGISGV